SPQHPVPPRVPGHADTDVADRLGGRHGAAHQASRSDRRLPRGGERSCARLSAGSRTRARLRPLHGGNRVDLRLRAGRGSDRAPARRPVHEGGVRRAGRLGAFEHRRCGDVRGESQGGAARAVPPRPPPYGWAVGRRARASEGAHCLWVRRGRARPRRDDVRALSYVPTPTGAGGVGGIAASTPARLEATHSTPSPKIETNVHAIPPRTGTSPTTRTINHPTKNASKRDVGCFTTIRPIACAPATYPIVYKNASASNRNSPNGIAITTTRNR